MSNRNSFMWWSKKNAFIGDSSIAVKRSTVWTMSPGVVIISPPPTGLQVFLMRLSHVPVLYTGQVKNNNELFRK